MCGYGMLSDTSTRRNFYGFCPCCAHVVSPATQEKIWARTLEPLSRADRVAMRNFYVCSIWLYAAYSASVIAHSWNDNVSTHEHRSPSQSSPTLSTEAATHCAKLTLFGECSPFITEEHLEDFPLAQLPHHRQTLLSINMPSATPTSALLRLLPTLLLSLFFLLLPSCNSQRFCPRGTFKNNGTCTSCPRGTFQPNVNAESCIPCPQGTFQPRRGTAFDGSNLSSDPSRGCPSCPPNTFNPKTASSSCSPCPQGTVSGLRFARCVKCPPGTRLRNFFGPTFLPCIPCSPGTFSSRPSNARCLPCPPGTISDERASHCTPCPAGTLHIRNKCRPCAAGTFNPRRGSDLCFRCPPGTISSTGAKQCAPCPKGQFSFTVASTKCLRCPPRTTSGGIRPAGCKHRVLGCPLQTFEDPRGECVACSPGERLDPRARACVPCASNEISEGGDATRCIRCPEGEIPAEGYALRDGAMCICRLGLRRAYPGGPCLPLRKACPRCAGLITQPLQVLRNGLSSNPGNAETRVQNCDFGKVANRDSTECIACGQNTFLNGTRCQRCPAGFTSEAGYKNEGERTSATVCISVQTQCTQFEVKRGNKCTRDRCPAGTLFVRRSRGCTRCDAGYFLNIEQRCFPCPPRKVSPGGATLKCTDCPPGFVGELDKCVCPNGMEERDGRCVNCGRGMFRKQSREVVSCKPCLVGTVATGEGNIRCVKCGKGFVTNVRSGATRCMACPRGTVEGMNLFGEESNRCVPRTPYGHSKKSLTSLPGVSLL